MPEVEIKNLTTWDTNEIAAFVKAALVACQRSPDMYSVIRVDVFRLSPVRRKVWSGTDQLPTMSVKSSGSWLHLKIPSAPSVAAGVTPLAALGDAMDNRLQMPERVRRSLLNTMACALKNEYSLVEDPRSDKAHWEHPRCETLPPISSSATNVRAKPEKTEEDLRALLWEVRGARRTIARRVEVAERRMSFLDKKEAKLEARLARMEERAEAKRRREASKQAPA